MRSMWAKGSGVWKQVYPTPATPATVTLTAGATAPTVANLSWTASTASDGSIVSYELDQDGVVTNVGLVTTYQKTGLTNGTAYAFKVRAVANTGAKGAWSNIVTITPLVPRNAATGGSIADVPNYKGSGQTWRVHTFTGNGTLTVTTSLFPFSVFEIGGGSGGTGGEGGAYGPASAVGKGGNGGAPWLNESVAIGVGSHSVVVGAGGAGGGLGGGASGAGGASYITGITPATAGGVAREGMTSANAEGGWGASGGPNGKDGGPGVLVDITGGQVTYSGGGGGGTTDSGDVGGRGRDGGGNGGSWDVAPGGAPANRGGGGGGGNGGGSAGAAGVVIVAYQIG